MVKQIVDVAIPLLTFFMMCLVGVDLDRHSLATSLRARKLVAGGILGQAALLPALALVLVAAFALPEPVAFGFILIAACPAGTISNFYVMLAGANVALSVILTILGCLASVLTLPLTFAVYGWWFGQASTITVPAKLLVGQLLVLVVVPVALGAWLRHKRPDLAGDHAPKLRILGLVALAALVGFVIVQDPVAVAEMMTGHVAPIVVFSAGCFLAGLLVARLLGAAPDDRITLGIEFMARNLAIAAAIAVTMLGRIELAAFAIAVFVYQVPLFLGAAWLHRRHAA